MMTHSSDSLARCARLLHLLGCALIAPAHAFADDLLVHTTANSGPGSLRQAVNDSNATSGTNTIVFSNTVTGTITLASELVIRTNATIRGPGPNVLTVSGNNASRIFNISGGTVSISGLTIANGQMSGDGGGIYNLGTLHASNCLFTANAANTGDGGAISSSGNLTADRCTFVTNRSYSGGALRLTGLAVVNNCTIVSNIALISGGGIYSPNGSNVIVASCTISGNHAAIAGLFNTGGGGIRGSAVIRNSIIAGNRAQGGQGQDVYGSFTSEGYNLIGKADGSTGWGGVGDQLGTTNSPINPKLAPLGNYGGSTPTMPPLSGSLTIDQGKSFGLTTDQLGRPRTHDQPVLNATLGDGTDIGAVEIGLPVSLLVTTTNDSVPGSLRQAVTEAVLSESATIAFASNVTNTITLTGGELFVGSTMVIAGPGPQWLTVSGNNSTRVFNNPGGTVLISGLTIANGRATNYGGGIFTQGTLSLSNCLFATNVAIVSGGAVSSSVNLNVNRCAFVGNSAQEGGALAVSEIARVNNTTIADNTAGGTDAFGGGIFSFGGLTVTGCTITGNRVGGNGFGGGIQGSASVRNTIIAANTAFGGPDVSGTFISEGYNLIGRTNGSTGWGAVGDQLGNNANPIDPNLLPLGMHGGSTPTMPPSLFGPAHDQGKSFGLTTDQRGRTRPATNNLVPSIPFGGDHSDIGAVENGFGIMLLVTTTNDAGAGSLRRTILDASSYENDMVTFAPQVTNRIVLTSGELVINKSLTIAGPGATVLTISGNNSNRVFHLTGAAATLQSLTIANGAAPEGGGILVDGGSHVISQCHIASNAATATFGSGGGVLLTSNAALGLYYCSVTHNRADLSGGGIVHNGSNSLTIINCTIASNRLTYIPDGIFYPRGGGIALVYGSSVIVNSTIASNYSTSTSGGFDNSTFYPGTVDIRNSIVAGNSAPTAAPDVLGPFISGGYNLIGNSSGGTGFGATGDQLNVNPLLGPLANYGGQTLTMALRWGSPAIDKGKSVNLIIYDQRVVQRPIDDPDNPNASGGDGADIGAYEADPRFRIVNISRVGNDVGLSLTTMLGKNYRAEYAPDLASVMWPVFTNNAPGNGHLLWVTNFGGANQPRRFYRSALD